MEKYINLPALSFLLFILLISGCKREDNPVEPPSDHFEPEGWVFTNSNQQPILVVWQGAVQQNWNGTALQDSFFVPLNSNTPDIFISFLDEDRNNLNPPDEEDQSVGFEISDTSRVDVIAVTSNKWMFMLRGKAAGITDIEVQLLHAGHVDVRTPKIPVIVR